KRWQRMTAAAALLALLWLAAGCADGRQLPADAPSVAPVTGTNGGATATARSRIAEPESSQPADPGASGSPASMETQASATPKSSKPVSDTSRPSATPQPEPSPSSKPARPSPSPSATAKNVIFSVVGNAKWGTIVVAEPIALQKNDTVADVLIRALKAHKLAFEKRGSGAMLYVVGIDGLYELDDGPTSGWKYRVNGKYVDVGAGSYEPKPGDKIEWYYGVEEELKDKGTTP
ncbi:MAG: hypothetical protein JWR03_194, partial [Cohnella sp.]|nr:hypothetical protein [Cohnella sp.]